ncbi:UvrD-helicase domain-containing protein [bacterium]|nr:UvrD-helicase domain-containing protein [bacterium]
MSTEIKEPFKPNAEQTAALGHGKNLCLCAGAGSGKTATLVAKYIDILEQGVDPGRILAFTFTEKAAAEMQVRVRQELALRLDAERDLQKAARLDQCRQQLAGGWISTIHAFGARILREQAAEAGIDPSFQLLPEEEADAMREAAGVRAVLDAAVRDVRAADMSARFLLHGGGPHSESLVDALAALHQKLQSYAVLPDDLEPGQDPAVPDFRAAAASLNQLAAGAPSGERLQIRIGEISAALSGVLNTAGPEAGTELFFHGLERARWDYSERRLKTVPGKMPAGFSELFESLSHELALIGDQLAVNIERDSIATLRELLLRMDLLYTDAKRRRGCLDFSDLEQLTIRLLSGHPEVRRHYRDRFEAVLVDEFQDVNPIQVRIVERLVDGRTAALFAVGDWEQSIYRFRGADVDEFNRLWKKLAAEGSALSLKRNHRSRRELVDAVNRLFGNHVWSAERIGDRRHPPFQRMEFPEIEEHPIPGCSDPGALETGHPCPPILWLRLPPGQNAGARRETEAAAVVAEIRSAGRPLQDYALLFRKMSSMEPFEESFRQNGIPYEIVKGGRAFESREVFDLLNVLTSVFDPSDHMACFGALRSCVGGLSDAGLLLISEGGDIRRAFLSDGPAPGELSARDRESLDRFKRLVQDIRARARMTPAALLSWVIGESGFHAISAGLGESAARMKNVDCLLRLASQFADHRPDPHRAFLETAWRLVRQRERQSAADDSEGSDCVKLMTIHQAKGLQFPVVVLPDLLGQTGASAPLIHFFAGPIEGTDRRSGRLAFRVDVPYSGSTWKTPGYEESCAREESAETEERERLLYVALTRAIDRLILPGPASAGIRKDGRPRVWDRKTFWPILASFLSEIENGSEKWMEIRDVPILRQADPPEAAPPDPESLRRLCESSGAGFITPPSQIEGNPVLGFPESGAPGTGHPCPPPRRSVHTARDFLTEEPARSQRAVGTFRFAVALGNLAHDLLARIPLHSDPARQAQWIDERIRHLRRSSDIPETQLEELSDNLHRFLKGSLAGTMRTRGAAGCLREYPFFLRMDRREINGKMDLLLVEDTAVTIVDYKYESPKENFGPYRGQLMAYALAVCRALDISEVTIALQFLIGAQTLLKEPVRAEDAAGWIQAFFSAAPAAVSETPRFQKRSQARSVSENQDRAGGPLPGAR